MNRVLRSQKRHYEFFNGDDTMNVGKIRGLDVLIVET